MADELGTVREIITRLLNNFSEDGMIALSRGRIEILDVAAMQKIVRSE